MTPAEVQAIVNSIQAKIVKLERVMNALHTELRETLRLYEAERGLPPGTIRPLDGDPKPGG